MTTKKSKNQIEEYLSKLDDDKNYYQDLSIFIKDINNLIQIPLRIKTPSGITGEEYALGYLLSLPSRNELGFDFESIMPYKEELTNPENFESYINALYQFLEDASVEKEVTGGVDDTYTISFIGDVDVVNEIQQSIIDWNTESTEEQAFSVDNQKVTGLVAIPQKSQDPETGDIYFKSYDYYSGPNMAINESNQYIDPTTGQLKKDGQGNVLTPVFRMGEATAIFEGLSQEAIFELQQELVSLGLDPSSYNFVPGVINFTAKGNEVDFVAQLMTQANDANAMFPQLGLIDKNAPTSIGKLRPFLEWKKGIDEQTNSWVESLTEKFAGEVVPPSEAEVKSVVDQLFIERGINPTARDYQKYASIFSNLQIEAANRAAEIEKNKVTLGDVIGLSKSYNTTSQVGPYTYGGFGVTTPSAEEARQQLGKPLLQPIDVTFELGKIMDDLEAGRIDASQELVSRATQAAEFKRNFMVFEENF
jgi:hypothetical protein